jgi:hypothetical protein
MLCRPTPSVSQGTFVGRVGTQFPKQLDEFARVGRF